MSVSNSNPSVPSVPVSQDLTRSDKSAERMVRIMDLANDLGVSSKAILDFLPRMAIQGKRHSSSISAAAAEILTRYFRNPDEQLIQVTAPVSSPGLRWAKKVDLIRNLVRVVLDEIEGDLRMPNDSLGSRIMRLRDTNFMSRDIACHLLSIANCGATHNIDNIPNAVALRIQKAWDGLQDAIQREDRIDDAQRGALKYFADAENQGATVVASASREYIYLDCADRPVIISYRALRSLLFWHLVQTVDGMASERYERIPHAPLGSDRVRYRLTEHGRNEVKLLLHAERLLAVVAREYGRDSQEYEAAAWEVRFKEMLRHKKSLHASRAAVG